MGLNKRGQGLSMTTIVVIILALLVLVVVAIIFMGGTGTVFDRIKNIFSSQSQTSVDLAIQQCNSWCDIAQDATDPSKSSFCTAHQKWVDKNRDTKKDKSEEFVFCRDIPDNYEDENIEGRVNTLEITNCPALCS